MVFIHIEKDQVMSMHRMETAKTIKTVIRDVVEEFGAPLDVTEREGITRMTYGDVDDKEYVVYVNEVKRIKWKG